MRFARPLFAGSMLAAGFIALAMSQAMITGAEPDLPLLVEEDFEKGAERWDPSDASAWRVDEIDGNHVYNQHKVSEYRGPHRSPYNMSLLKDVVVSDFVLDARARSMREDQRAHRDMCVFFNYQDPAHFYYVHLGLKADDHANQIFIVNGADRKMISERSSEGTPWDDEWHHLRVVRRVADGTIEIYFDNMDEPAMVAHDKTFTWGQVGIGSFDDMGLWDDVKLHGRKSPKPE